MSPPRDVERLRGEIETTKRRLTWLSEQLEVLHDLAFEKADTNDDGDKVTSTRTEFYLDEVGRADAKHCWRDLRKVPADVSRILAHASDILTGGSGAQVEFRGTLISPAEFREAIAAQRRRRRNGDYTPPATAPQPAYPARSSR